MTQVKSAAASASSSPILITPIPNNGVNAPHNKMLPLVLSCNDPVGAAAPSLAHKTVVVVVSLISPSLKDLQLIPTLLKDILGLVDSRKFPHESKEFVLLLEECSAINPQDWVASQGPLDKISTKLLQCFNNLPLDIQIRIVNHLSSPNVERPTFFSKFAANFNATRDELIVKALTANLQDGNIKQIDLMIRLASLITDKNKRHDFQKMIYDNLMGNNKTSEAKAFILGLPKGVTQNILLENLINHYLEMSGAPSEALTIVDYVSNDGLRAMLLLNIFNYSMKTNQLKVAANVTYPIAECVFSEEQTKLLSSLLNQLAQKLTDQGSYGEAVRIALLIKDCNKRDEILKVLFDHHIEAGAYDAAINIANHMQNKNQLLKEYFYACFDAEGADIRRARILAKAINDKAIKGVVLSYLTNYFVRNNLWFEVQAILPYLNTWEQRYYSKAINLRIKNQQPSNYYLDYPERTQPFVSVLKPMRGSE